MSFHPFRPIKEALQGIYRHGLMSFASITILAACMIIIGSVLLIVENLNAFVSQLQDQNEVVVFVDESLDKAAVQNLENVIKGIPNIESVEYRSKDESLEEYKAMFGDQADLFDTLDENNPLRDSFHIKVADLENYNETIAKIEAVPEIVNIRSSSKVVDMLVNLRQTISLMGVWVLAILLFVSLFIISNTVRLAMFSRRTEINIMKYVGATNHYIRRPFIYEGLIIGIISCVIAFALQWYVYEKVIYPLMLKLSLFEAITFDSVKFYVLIGFAVFAIVMGVFGSILPMRKHLKV